MENPSEQRPIPAEDLYKSLIESKDLSSHLSNFVSQAENFNANISEYDVVKNYLKVSGNCKEVLQLIKDMSNSDSQIAVLIMKTLYHILTRVATDLPIFMSVGTSITNEILTCGMRSLFNFLKIKQKSSRTKLALHLLIAMVSLGGHTTSLIVSKINFSSISVPLLNRRNFSEEEDIRTVFINLIIIILRSCDSNVIRQLVEIKGFLNDVLPGLISDRVQTILLVLSTFRSRIVQNPVIGKTMKLRLFNDHSLKSVLKLYVWKGPIRFQKTSKRKLGQEEQSIAYEVSEEEAKSVQVCAHEFMLSLCCSYKTGIIFHDSSCGTSGKNLNHVMTRILAYMPRPHRSELACEFVISVLKTCPDQIVFYLPYLKDIFKPRVSSQWLNAVNAVKKIILALNPVSCVFKSEERRSVATLINIAKTVCFPDIITSSEISSMFKDGKAFICYHLCDFLVCVLNQVKSIIVFCSDTNSTSLYSSADISTFHQSFLSTIIQDFTFMKDLEEYWVKVTSGTAISPEETTAELSLPLLSNQLLKILEVFQFFVEISHQGYQNYELNISKLFQCFKECQSTLSREEVCNINIKIVDIIAAQGEEVIALWDKQLNDSPLMVILDVYLTSPSKNMVEDISPILNKVLVYTKLFEYCPWEINVWLEAMKASKAKHVPFIIEFLNQIMCISLQNPSMFSDCIIENAFGKSHSSSSTFDVATMLNDLVSKEKDPILIEDSSKSENAVTTPKQCFSSLVPAALFTLSSVEDHKRKSCQSFMEKVLYHVMHHQQEPSLLFPVIQKYKANISSPLYHYFELLCHGKFVKKMLEEDDMLIMCKKDLSDHLKMKFLTLHTVRNTPKGCYCDIQWEDEQLDNAYKEKIVWQLLAYINWELSSILEDKRKNNAVLNYLTLLESILSTFEQASVSTNEASEITDSSVYRNKTIKLDIVREILNHPVMLKLFLCIEKVPTSVKSVVKDCVECATKFILNFVSEMSLEKEHQKCLIEFKDKTVKFNSSIFQASSVKEKTVLCENLDICEIIRQFSTLFSGNDITFMVENMLNLDTENVNIALYFSALLLIFRMYADLKDFVLLSPKSINSLFIKYVNMSKKQKKILRPSIVEMFEKHPSLAAAVSSDTCDLLLEQPSNKNFYLLGPLIQYNKKLRTEIQSTLVLNIESLKQTPEFIFLVSKCILSSTESEIQDTTFQETVSLTFWQAVTNCILTDISLHDELLENCDAGKSLQALFTQNILSLKRINKYFVTNEDPLKLSVPSSSKLLVLLQIMEIINCNIMESSKSILPILKITFTWLTSVTSSMKTFLVLDRTPLLEFIYRLLQNVPDLDLSTVTEVESFFRKVLKIALNLEQKETGSKIIDIVTAVCQKSKSVSLPVQPVFSLVYGHSNFFSTMLCEDEEGEKLKECVVDLLITLVKAENSVCKDDHLAVYLSAYTATLKSVDQKILYLMKLYEESGTDITKLSPVLWSRAAVAHYSILNSGTKNLMKKPKLQDVLSLFLPERIETTVIHYPLTIKLDPSISVRSEEVGNCPLDKIYDLRFVLPLFANLLSPGAFVHCESFMDSTVLMLIFTSLSSFDPVTRSYGYYCLSQLHMHLEGANYREKQMWLSVLNSLRNSVTSENPRIPSIVSLFLAKAIHIFVKTGSTLFDILHRFIMIKPCIDIGHVPEFYVLFNSIDAEHRVQRLWLLRLLSEGLRSSLDFHICQKRYIFNLLLTHYSSALSSLEEEIEILNIISAAVKVDTVAQDLCRNGLLPWLNNIIDEQHMSDAVIFKCMCTLIKNLWKTTKKFCYQRFFQDEDASESSEDQKKTIYVAFPRDFQLFLLNFTKRLKIVDVSAVNNYLMTLLDITSLLKRNRLEMPPNDLCSSYIADLLHCWQLITKKGQSLDDQSSTEKGKNCIFSIKECSLLFSRIILFWYPNWNAYTCEKYYKSDLLLFLNTVNMMLKFQDSSLFYMSDVPKWLYKCFKEDEKNELVKLFLSASGENCLKLILDMFEQSLSFQHFNDANNLLLYESKKVSTSYWGKIILYFKKICNTYNLIPELSFYNQITMVI